MTMPYWKYRPYETVELPDRTWPDTVLTRAPIWLGGRTMRSLRRALAFGDGWDPFGLSLPALTALLDRARALPEWAARPTPFDLVLPVEPQTDPTDAAERARLVDVLEAHRTLGATIVHLRFRHRSLAHCLEQLEAFAADVMPGFATDTAPRL